MNPSEFKAWFDGFTESLSGVPSRKQWERIQAKVREIKDAPPTSYPVFVDRWVRAHPYWWNYAQPVPDLQYQYLAGTSGNSLQETNLNAYQSALNTARQQNEHEPAAISWNSGDAFRDLGRAEALSMTAQETST